MKELSIEEKARAYDEALERAKEIVNDPNASSIWKGWLCNCFPELKESEDENIRKALIEYFNEQCDMSDWNGVYGYQVIAWLEKQGQVKESQISQHEIEKCKENDDFLTSEDEKIRKEIIDFIYDKTDTYELREKSNSWLAWLEKQGETSTEDFGEFINILSKQFPEVSFAKLSRIAVRVKKWLEKQAYPVLSNSSDVGKDEQKPAELPKGEDYGIDGLCHAINILQRTLGEVEGYQSDDGILEHKCAISAVKELYESCTRLTRIRI